MILYELFHARIPFFELLDGDVQQKIYEGKRPEIADHCPKEWKQLMMECWDEDPNRVIRLS